MYPLKKSISIALGLLVLAAVAVVITTGTVGASPSLVPIAAAPPTPAIPVAITNTPLPVTGTVNANIGTPTVNLNSTRTTPVYVDSDRPARHGFNATCTAGDVDPVYGQASCTLYTIPAGAEVVIENLTCAATIASGGTPGQADLVLPNVSAGPNPSGQAYLIPLALTKLQTTSYTDLWQLMTPFRAYGSAFSDGGVDIGLFFRTNPSSTPQYLGCTISGYIVQ